MKKSLLAVVLLLFLLLPGVAYADYTTSNGLTVSHAGGDNIVVRDSGGNVVYSGAGVRTGDRLAPPSSVLGSTGTSRSQIDQAIRDTGGYYNYSGGSSGGSSSGGSSGRSGSNSTTYDWSPYPNTVRTGQQNLQITLPNGTTSMVRGDIFANLNNPMDGRMAVPQNRLSAEVRAALDAAGIPKDGNGYYLISSARNNPNVQVGWQMQSGTVKWDEWTGNQGVDPNVANYNTIGSINPVVVDPNTGAVGTGGRATLTIIAQPQSSGGSSGGWTYNPYIPPDTRSMTASLDPREQQAGQAVTVRVSITGTAANVVVKAPWGQVSLSNQGSGVWQGKLNIPYATTQGTYTVTVEADISQPPHYPAQRFSLPLALRVLPPPDTRSLQASLLQPVVGAGSSMVVTATVSGTADYVRVVTPWGAALDMQRSGSAYQAVIPVPEGLSGILPVVVSASISQPPHYPAKLYQQELMLTVKSGWEPGEELPPVESENPDWWTPPWAQQG